MRWLKEFPPPYGRREPRASSDPFAPAREFLLGILALAALNAALAPDDPFLLGVSPHPILAVVAVVAYRSGLVPGALAGLIGGALHLGGQLLHLRAAGGLGAGALEHLALGAPIAAVAVGVALGELRRRRGEREEAERREATELRGDRDAMRTRLAIAEQARREVERRLLEPAATMAVLYEAAQRLEALDEPELYPAILEVAATHLSASVAALYALEGGKLRLKAWRGTEAPPEERDPADGLLGLAVRERRVVSARDILTSPDLAPARGEGALLAAPIQAPDGEPIAAIEVAEMPFLSLTASAQRILGMLAGWAARAADRARYARSVREKAIYDESVGALRYGYFVDRLAEEFERSRRYGEPFSILLLEVIDWEAIPAEGREPLRRALAQALKNVLRRVDAVFVYKDERSLAAALPHTPAAGAARARDRIAEEIERFGIAPYRRAGALEFAIGVATRVDEMRSPADLASAAENAAASPMRKPPEVATAAGSSPRKKPGGRKKEKREKPA